MFSRPRRTGFRILPAARRSRFADSSAPAGGSTYWTGTVRMTDGSVADVQAKINAASSGDIIQIPAGSFTWASGVTCSKGVLIRGAGGGRLEGSSASSLAIGTGSKSFTIRSGTVVSAGFTVDETIRAVWKANHAVYMEGTVTSWNGTTLVLNVTSTAGSGTYDIWNFLAPAATTIINNVTGNLFDLTESAANHIGFTGCYIEQGTGAGKVFQAAPTTGGKPIIWYDFRSKDSPGEFIDTTMSRGLVFRWYAHGGGPAWNGAANGAFDIFGVRIKHFSPSANGWNQANTMGAADTTGTSNLYVENCYFAGCGMVTDWDDNARGVFRYSVLDNSTAASHGADTSFHGMLHVEYYNNVCVYDDNGDDSANLQSFFEWRGGTGVFADNVIDDIAGALVGSKSEIKLQIQCLDRSAGPYGLWGQGVSGAQYPAPRQVGLGNITGTTSVTATSTNSNGTANNDDFGIYKGDYCPIYAWGNSGAGNYTNPAIEASGYNQGTPDSAADYIQVGRDWINDTKPGYTKYTHPHPLRTGVEALSVSGYYFTEFSATENPMSEGGAWTVGSISGNPWTAPRTAGGLCYGTQAGNSNADDSVAHLSGFSANHRAKLVIRKAAGSFQFQEVEILLRASITAGSFKCIEVNLEQAGEYLQIWQWLGGYTTGQPTPFVKQVEGIAVSSLGTSVADGSVLEAQISDGQVKVWLNGILAFDTNYYAWADANGYEMLTTGQPGIGFYTQNQPQTNAFCAKSFEAWNI